MAQNQTMQAIRFHDHGGPDQLVMDQVPMPEPSQGQVLVRVYAAGVNPVDWKIRAGWMREFLPTPLPAGTGRDFAGMIEALGPGVTGFMQGQAVFGMAESGSYAQYVVASTNHIAPKPDRLSFDEAASVPVGGVTAWRALFDAAHLQTGQRILVQGAAGGVGLFAVQLAAWKGAHVTGTASGGNADFVRSLGAEQVIDYRTTPVQNAVHDMDVVLDTVGGDVLEQSYGLVRSGGILVTIAGRPDDEKAGQRNIMATSVGPAAESASILRELGQLLQMGKLKTYLQKVLPLDQAGQAQSISETGHGRGHLVLHVAD
jgi:NADPH:quinone reductase-like Zn-dependent oxidoreductase